MIKREPKQGIGRSPDRYEATLYFKKLVVFAFTKGEARAKMKKLIGDGEVRLPVGIKVVKVS